MNETWLNEIIPKEADFEQYKTFPTDRVNTKQGRTAVYVQSRLEGKLVMKISHKY